jgi:GNAT superfamily N-acetyltransferase
MYEIRPARNGDLALLPELERAASARFAGHPLAAPFASTLTPAAALREGLAHGRLWVAESAAGEVVGFALASEVGADAHLQEVDVLPEHGRRGVGSALVETVCAWAHAAGFASLTLTTLEDVAWNAPYYRKLGFDVIPETDLDPAHRELLREEAARGFGSGGRVAMRRAL